MRTGDAIAASFFGILLMAWRRQLPRRAPGNSVPHTAGRAVKAIGQDAPDPIGRLLLGCGALKRAVGLGKGYCTGLLSVAQMPEDTSADHGRQIHLVGETTAVFLIGQEIGGQRQPTPGQHRHETLVTEGADQTIEGHR